MYTIKFKDSGATMELSREDSKLLFPELEEWLDVVLGFHDDVIMIKSFH